MDERIYLDKTVLAKLSQLGPGFPRKLINLFLEHTPRRLDTALAGGRAGDWKAVEDAAHSLKSSAGNLGADRLRLLADRVENLAGEVRAAGADAATPFAGAAELAGLLAELEETYARTRASLIAEKERTAP